MTGPDAEQLRQEVRSRRLALLMALATLIREARSATPRKSSSAGPSTCSTTQRRPAAPTVPDVLRVIEEGPDTLRSAARADTAQRYQDRVGELVFTLDLLCTGIAGRGVRRRHLPADRPGRPRSQRGHLRGQAAGDKLLTAAMLCTWSYGFGCVDAAAALADPARPRAAPTWG